MSNQVSVIIPAHNPGEQIHLAFGSTLLNNDPRQVLIFDDYSSPPIEDVGAWRPFGWRSGVCFARNFLIHHARHDLIVPLDADDWVYPDALQRLCDAWQPGTWVYGNHTEVDEDGAVIREVEAPPPGLLHRKNLTYATMLFHKDDWQRAGGYDPDFELGAEDYAFQVALTASGVRPVKLEGAPIYKRTIHTNSRTRRATDYFPLLHSLIRQKWPSVFTGNH